MCNNKYSRAHVQFFSITLRILALHDAFIQKSLNQLLARIWDEPPTNLGLKTIPTLEFRGFDQRLHENETVMFKLHHARFVS